MTYPILEFDPAPEAVIEPSRLVQPGDVPTRCVICFFHEVLEQVVSERNARILFEHHWEDGPHPLYEIEYCGQRLAFFQPGVGAPMAAGLLEETIALGCRQFIACGGCGVLEPGIAVGHLIVVSAAVRDEGVSYHYVPPSREIVAQEQGVAALVRTMERQHIPFRVGKTWTIDAPYRETRHKVERRRQEGCLVVEMEAASMMAVAQHRGVLFGQVLYGGDDLSGDEWDNRSWQSRTDIRRNLFWLAADACLELG